MIQETFENNDGLAVAELPTGDAQITNTNNAVYTFPKVEGEQGDMKKVTIQLRYGYSGGYLRVAWNTVATVANSFHLTAGDMLPSPDGMRVRSVGVYANGATLTYGVDFNILGFR